MTYCYVASAVNAYGESGNSNEACAASATVTTVNCGGPAVGQFPADWGFTGGSTGSKTATIDTSAVTNPAPMAVYQTYRLGTFSYTMGGFTPGATCKVRLHLAEIYFTAANSRMFNVSINGTQVLASFDIFAVSGAKNKANIQEFNAAANASGQFVIQFTSVKDNSLCCGIEVVIPLAAVPAGLAATPGNGQVSLRWNASTGATSYNIKRATVSGGPYTTISTSSAMSYVDSGVTNGITSYYVVSAVNTGGESNNSTEVAALPLSPIQSWRQTAFGTIDANDAVAGDTATPRGDGVANLMKYALGLDPAKSYVGGLPVRGTNGAYLALTFNRQQNATDITYRVEATSDLLGAWAEIWNSSSVPYGGGGNPSQAVTVTDTVTMSGAPGGHRFMRLKVTRP